MLHLHICYALSYTMCYVPFHALCIYIGTYLFNYLFMESTIIESTWFIYTILIALTSLSYTLLIFNYLSIYTYLQLFIYTYLLQYLSIHTYLQLFISYILIFKYLSNDPHPRDSFLRVFLCASLLTWPKFSSVDQTLATENEEEVIWYKSAERRLNLSRSWHKGHSRTYNTPFFI